MIGMLDASFVMHRRKSQIQTFLEQNEGPGLQHLALKTRDIFHTITKMREAEKNLIGFELMIRPSDEYYRELPTFLGDRLSVRDRDSVFWMIGSGFCFVRFCLGSHLDHGTCES